MLNVVRLRISAIEAVIALSIVFLAVEDRKGLRDTLTWRRPIVVASACGLLHGFGFAAVLREIGLPEDGLVIAMFAFNLGTEIGQVVFAAAILALLAAARILCKSTAAPAPVAKFAGYVVGTLASLCIFKRLLPQRRTLSTSCTGQSPARAFSSAFAARWFDFGFARLVLAEWWHPAVPAPGRAAVRVPAEKDARTG